MLILLKISQGLMLKMQLNLLELVPIVLFLLTKNVLKKMQKKVKRVRKTEASHAESSAYR